jgi:hypothetical protein
VTTALEIPPNWYPDPSGRGQARYWDGRMWTAHVVRDGAATLDRSMGSNSPGNRRLHARSHAGRPAPTVGHGTLSLQQMAAGRPAPRRKTATSAGTGRARISTLGAVGVFLGALALLGLCVVLFRGSVSGTKSSPDLERTVSLETADYSMEVPSDWIAQDAASLEVDGAYLVPDAEPVSVVITDDTVDGLALPTIATSACSRSRRARVAGAVSSHRHADPREAHRGRPSPRLRRGVRLRRAGVAGRVASSSNLVEHDGRVVAVLVIGTPAAVNRHRGELQRAAASTSFTESGSALR